MKLPPRRRQRRTSSRTAQRRLKQLGRRTLRLESLEDRLPLDAQLTAAAEGLLASAEEGPFVSSVAEEGDYDFGDATLRRDTGIVAGPALAGLSLGGTDVHFGPEFVADTLRYAIRPGAEAANLTITALTGSPDDLLMVDGRSAKSGVAVPLGGLADGEKIRVEVSNPVDGQRTYELVYLPVGFPRLDVTTLEPGVSDDPLYVTFRNRTDGPYFVATLDNNGVPDFVRGAERYVNDFKLHPNGQYSYAEQDGLENEFGRDDNVEVVLDSDFNEIGRFQTVGLNHTDVHEFLILPDGNHLFLSYNGEVRDGTTFEDSIVQVVNPTTGEEVFRWNSKDDIPIEDVLRRNVQEYAHANSVFVDDDGNYIVSLRGTSQIVKIDGTSGELIWKLGGLSSDFAIDDELGGPCGQHTAALAEGGNLVYFDNGVHCPDLPGYEDHPGVTRVAEYALDETEMTAELVWSYSHEERYSPSAGSSQRLTNGNTLIGWGNGPGVLATEVDAAGNKLFEITIAPDETPYTSYRAQRFATPTYPTLLADNGARHLLGSGLFLGAAVDAEPDAQPDSAALGDDRDILYSDPLNTPAPPGDEAGVDFTGPLIAGQTAQVDVTASDAGLLSGWIDLNRDGDWSDAGEQIFADAPLAAGVNQLSFAVPHTAETGPATFARFRLSTAAGLSFDGAAPDGEVEDYTVSILSGTTVTHTGDSGFGSLRSAITWANEQPGVQTIDFNIAGDGPHTIRPASALPTVTDPAIIDGTTQPGGHVQLDGSLAGPDSDGLAIAAGGSTVRGLVINRFDGDGIELTGPGGNSLEANLIGTDATGGLDLGNGDYGVRIFRSPDNVVGGTSVDAGNTISGNGLSGVLISGNASAGNLVGYNRIGTDASGTAGVGNGRYGVQLFAAVDNTIENNLVSANGGSGLALHGGAADNTIAGNQVGTDVEGASPLGNAGHGVWVSGGTGNTVVDNLVSSNGRSGVVLVGASTENVVADNLVGTDVTGAAPLGNAEYGVQIGDGGANTIEGNLISGNGRSGVVLNWATVDNTLHDNQIGTDLAGTADLGNGRFGVWMSGASGNTLDANTISGNARSGIALVGGSTANVVRDNRLGTDGSGTVAVGNADYGVQISGGSENRLEGNVISGNGRTGVVLQSSSSNTIRDNRVGADLAGAAAVANGRYGIWISGGADNTLEANIVSGNERSGVVLRGGSSGNRVVGNLIGVGADGTTPLGNFGYGLQILSSSANTIGGDGDGNTIAANGASGVYLAGAASTGNVVLGNAIGTDATGTLDLGNAWHGVHFAQAASDNTIGTGNAIAFQGGVGVRLHASNTGNAILGNAIYENAGPGIDLVSGGATVNDAGDADTGANNLQNTPEIDGDATLDGSDLLLSYRVDSLVANSAYDLRVEFFKADVDGQEGRVFLGADIYTAADLAAGNKPITLTGIVGLSPGDRIVATATDAAGNTSEFSLDAPVVAPSLPLSGLASGIGGDADFLAAVDEVFAEGESL